MTCLLRSSKLFLKKKGKYLIIITGNKILIGIYHHSYDKILAKSWLSPLSLASPRIPVATRLENEMPGRRFALYQSYQSCLFSVSTSVFVVVAAVVLRLVAVKRSLKVVFVIIAVIVMIVHEHYRRVVIASALLADKATWPWEWSCFLKNSLKIKK